MRLARPIVSLVSDRRRLEPPQEDALVTLATRAARAGVTLIQIRERDLPDAVLVRVVREIVERTRDTGSAVVVNDRADVAIAAGAAGVHLRGDSPPASRVRSIVPAAFLIGRSVHSVEEAVAAERDGAVDYLVFGTVFPSASKPAGLATGIEALAATARSVGVPVVAIGGMTAARAHEVAAAGAAGLAAIGLFIDGAAGKQEPDGLTALVSTLRAAFDT